MISFERQERAAAAASSWSRSGIGGVRWVRTHVGPAASGVALHVFSPWFELPLGAENGSASLGVPPILEILDLCERERYTEIVVGMPGPLGLAGLLAARLLGVPLVALVRTDVPT